MIYSKYPIRTFGDILERIDRSIALDDLADYKCIGIRLYGQGGFIREEKSGISIKRKKQWIVRKGDIIYNKLFAWKGTFCIADSLIDGAIASDKFPTYVSKEHISKDYLALWFQSDELANEARLLSRGAAALSKFTLNPPDFLRMPIPLPSTPEQERIASRVNGILGKLEKVKKARKPVDAVFQGRRAGVGSELRHVMSAALSQFSRTFESSLTVLDDALIMKPRSGPSFPCSEDGKGVAVVMPSALGGFRLDLTKCLYGNGTESLSEMDILSTGDLLISRGNKRDQVGLCVVYDSKDKRTFANLLMRFQVNKNWRPEFVKYWLMTPIAIRHIRKNTRGTSPSVQKINQRGIITTPFPRPISIDIQDVWISRLDRAFNAAETLETLARNQDKQIEQTKKAILSAAFRGDL
jgi:type I restriction enzyme S subunit